MEKLLSFARLVVTYVALNAITLDPKNPRRHTARQIRQIARSMKVFGIVVPLLIDRHNKVVCGYGRFLAAQSLGFTEVPVIRLEHLSEAQAQAFQIADNRLAETSEWDDRFLAESLKELSELNLDFSLETTGFEMGEIDLRIEALSPTRDQSDPKDDVLPHQSDGSAVTQRGDIWLLNQHRICCGNAADRGAVEGLMGGKRAGMAFLDPPYNVPIDGHASGLGAIHHREFAMASGEMNSTQFTSLLTLALTAIARNSVNGAIVFACMDWRHLGELLSAGQASRLELKNICVWVKHNAGMGSLYRSQYENVAVFKVGRGRHRNNIELGRHGRHRSNVWSYPSTNNFGRATDEGHLLALHPTVKPVRLVADAVLDCSERGDIVADTFVGSGTTLIAAERTGRRCYGVDLDPHYVDTSIRRWQAYTGDYAVHAVSGRRFDEVAAGMEACHD
jgi:DNA modification methylase